MGFMSGAAQNVFGAVGHGVQGIAGSLTAQNGYQASMAPMNRIDVNPNLQEQYKTFTGVQNQQQQLADVLQAQMNGNGPNPAQMQFQQNAGQIGAQAAGLVASQKGINPALAARLAAQQQAQAGQNAAGAAATMQAQQQLATQQQLQQQQAQMGGQAMGAENMFLNANNAQNQQLGTNFNSMQGLNAGIAGQNAQEINKTTQGLMQGASSAMAMGAAHGGMIPSLSDALMQGGFVPGQANVAGDSSQNDTVHAMLSPGEIVIPRSLAEDPERAKKFIEHLNAGGMAGYGKVLAAKKRAK